MGQLWALCTGKKKHDKLYRSASEKEKKMVVPGTSYRLIHKIGQGGFGEVWLACHEDTQENVALKFIKPSGEAAQAKALENEVRVMEALDHRHVIQLRRVFWDAVHPGVDERGDDGTRVMLVEELASGGELFAFLVYTMQFPEVLARTLFKQLVDALIYCHAKGVTHRDLKPENIFLSADYQVKVGDFGLASLQEGGAAEGKFLRTECGSAGYMAPEIVAGEPYLGPPADVWGAGLILFIMLTGRPPFKTASETDPYFHQLMHNRPFFWEWHSLTPAGIPHRMTASAQQLLDAVFVRDPAARLTLEAIRDHPWLAEETVAAEELVKEMSRRKREVQRCRKEERRKKKAEKVARRKEEEKRRKRRREERKAAGMDLSPFNDMLTYRSAAGASSPPPVLGAEGSDDWPEDAAKVFCADVPFEALVDRVCEAVHALGGAGWDEEEDVTGSSAKVAAAGAAAGDVSAAAEGAGEEGKKRADSEVPPPPAFAAMYLDGGGAAAAKGPGRAAMDVEGKGEERKTAEDSAIARPKVALKLVKDHPYLFEATVTGAAGTVEIAAQVYQASDGESFRSAVAFYGGVNVASPQIVVLSVLDRVEEELADIEA